MQQRAAISCDDVQKIRDGYILNPLTKDPRQSAPYAANHIVGERTAAGVLRELYGNPWSP